MVNKRQTTSTSLNTSLCPNRRQRRTALDRARAVLIQAEDLLVVAIFFVVFLYPFLLDPTLLFNLSAWLWWVKGFAWIGLLAWAAIRLLVGLPMVPAQLTGASVEAMEQAEPEKELISFTAVPPNIESTLLPWRQSPTLIEQETCTQLQKQWRQLWQRPCRRSLINSPFQRFIPLPSRSLEPSA